MIIDIHAHLGDILNSGGGKLIDQTDVQKKIFFDVTTFSEHLLHGGFPRFLDEPMYHLVYPLVTRASRARNATATLENMRNSLDESGVSKCACMPIPPFLTFSDLKKAREKEPRIIPFTGVDPNNTGDIEADLRADVEQGARGLKLHPIIHRAPLNGKKTMETVEAFAVHDLPVLFHCGISSYYPGTEKNKKEDKTLGEIFYARDLANAFPNVCFVAGHAGLYKYRDVIELLAPCPNVMVDISFQSPARVRKLLRSFGPERVMYASDWPFGNRKPAIQVIKKACRGDTALEQQIFYDNAASILKLA